MPGTCNSKVLWEDLSLGTVSVHWHIMVRTAKWSTVRVATYTEQLTITILSLPPRPARKGCFWKIRQLPRRMGCSITIKVEQLAKLETTWTSWRNSGTTSTTGSVTATKPMKMPRAAVSRTFITWPRMLSSGLIRWCSRTQRRISFQRKLFNPVLLRPCGWTNKVVEKSSWARSHTGRTSYSCGNSSSHCRISTMAWRRQSRSHSHLRIWKQLILGTWLEHLKVSCQHR